MTQAQLREFKFTNDSAPIEYLPIVAEPTQVHTLKFFGASSSIQIKREDQTHLLYGGIEHFRLIGSFGSFAQKLNCRLLINPVNQVTQAINKIKDSFLTTRY